MIQAAIAHGAIYSPLHAEAQSKAVKRLAYLSTSSARTAGHLQQALVDGLRNVGWESGRNLIIDVRYLEGDLEKAPLLVSQLLELKPDGFVTNVDRLALLAVGATRVVPVVFVLGFDPVGTGLVKSLARPGASATGFSILNMWRPDPMLTTSLAALQMAS